MGGDFSASKTTNFQKQFAVSVSMLPAKDSNTTSLHRHLQYSILLSMQCFHPTDTTPYTVTEKAQLHQPTVLGAVVTKCDKDSPRWAQCTLTVSKYLAKNMSFNTVEKVHSVSCLRLLTSSTKVQQFLGENILVNRHTNPVQRSQVRSY